MIFKKIFFPFSHLHFWETAIPAYHACKIFYDNLMYASMENAIFRFTVSDLQFLLKFRLKPVTKSAEK